MESATWSLPFDPYAGAVKRLNAIRAELRQLDVGTARDFHVNGLQRAELIATHSKIQSVWSYEDEPTTSRDPNAGFPRDVVERIGHGRDR